MKVYLGVDVGSEEHALHFLDQEGREVQDKMKIKNDRQGFSRLAEKIDKLRDRFEELTIKVGIESTGDYWRNLFTFLNSLDSEGKLSSYRNGNLVAVKAGWEKGLRRCWRTQKPIYPRRRPGESRRFW